MKPLRRNWSRFLGSLWPGRSERELADELASHIEMQTDDNLRAGMTPDQARRAARLKFGAVDSAKEDYRDQRGLPSLDALFADFRYAFRGLRKSPAFTTVAVLTLAVGIGATTAVFSIVDQVLLRPRGIVNPERVITVRTAYAKIDLEFIGGSNRTMADLAESTQVFERAAMGRVDDANYFSGGTPQRLVGATVTEGWFDVFGAKPFLGRTFTKEEDQPNASPVTILSYGTWQQAFGSDPSIIGRNIELNQVRCEVIGVAAPGFRLPDQADLWIPAGLPSSSFTAENRFNENHMVVARTRQGVTTEAARQWLRMLTQRVYDGGGQGSMAKDVRWSITAVPWVDAIVGETKAQLWLLFGAVSLVVLIACANIAGLLLARASSRSREFAVRAALGASSLQIMRGILAESFIIAAFGCAAGVVLARGGIAVLLALAPQDTVVGLQVTLSPVVLLFAAAVAAAAAVLFGLAPMWWVARSGLSGGRSLTAGRARTNARSLLVVAETALAVVLLVAGGLFLRSLTRLENVQPGFNPSGVMTAWITPPPKQYPVDVAETGARDALFRTIVERLRSSPGVSSAALGSLPPFMGGPDAGVFEIEGREVRKDELSPHGNWRRVTGGYFETLAIPLRRGRFLTDDDRNSTERVMVIDENLARKYWPDSDPIGQRIRRFEKDVWFRIVGIVGHVLDSNLAVDDGKGTYYAPLYQRSSEAVVALVKTTGDVNQLASVIRDATRAGDPRLPVHTVRSMPDAVARSLAPRKFGMQLVGFFAAVGLFLAALGLYGVMSYSVTQRNREIGIRLALGARPNAVLGMVVGQGIRLATIGAAIGLVASVVGGQWLGSLLFGVNSLDSTTLVSVVGVLLAAAILASYLPARRAVRIDPAVALRPE